MGGAVLSPSRQTDVPPSTMTLCTTKPAAPT
jgi:hypothetical protein